jgi:hypothetical protein
MRIYDFKSAADDLRKAVARFNAAIKKIDEQYPVGFVVISKENNPVYCPLVDLPPGRYNLHLIERDDK